MTIYNMCYQQAKLQPTACQVAQNIQACTIQYKDTRYIQSDKYTCTIALNKKGRVWADIAICTTLQRGEGGGDDKQFESQI